MVVVDQRDLTVADVDVARHLNERRLGGRHDAERITDRAPVPGHHPKKQIGGARLIALEDRLGQHVKVLVLANLVSVQQHRGDPLLTAGNPAESLNASDTAVVKQPRGRTT